ncbi:uncharacterized protein BT62DRAFT_927720 [Guyanagaster necrorhizus]|uniref:Uncharacterized protein n=1 Tax=Guyanagaster necrorhizus TaxID=856835 RepID=A0A9P7W1Q7_9AGAR|nr:uncharacterized protein BT62DRAFT_927720 [Guyanagaster necrorhizus MCA 3950]KAG7450420.1 hypothetical protein BT62DRAFT_927720 [Guyanagaster necrorhizus MCA 3950]
MDDDHSVFNSPILYSALSSHSSRHLIQPDIDAGLLTPSDCKTLQNYFNQKPISAPNVWSAAIGVLAIQAIRLFDRQATPFWRKPWTFAVVTGASAAPLIYFRKVDLDMQNNVLQRLENPDGVKQTYLNAKARFAHVAAPTPESHLDDPQPALGHRPVPLAPSISSPAPSRWEQIRAANAQNPGASSWDTLRQNHERVCVRRSQLGGSSNPEELTRDDQATEQARFDALLEQERNFGQTSNEFQRNK